MRVLLLTSTFPRYQGDGTPRFIQDLAMSLSAHAKITVLAPHAPGALAEETWGAVEVRRYRYAPESMEKLAYGGGMLAQLRHNPLLWAVLPFFLCAQVLAIRRLLASQRFDLVHAHWLIPQGLAAVLAIGSSRYRPPLICTLHGADLFALRGRVFRILKRWTLGRMDHVAVVSPAMLDTVRAISGRDLPTSVNPMGVDTDMFAPREKFSQRRPQSLLFVGRLVKKKGLEVLLQAFARLAVAYPAASLKVVGDGPLRGQLEGNVAGTQYQDRISFYGWRSHEEIAGVMRESALFVFPSMTANDGDAEGLGLTLIEAMASGCAVVASDLPVVSHVLRAGENCELTPSGDAAALAQRISKLFDNPAEMERQASNAQATSRDSWDWKEIATSHATLYDSVMRKQSG